MTEAVAVAVVAPVVVDEREADDEEEGGMCAGGVGSADRGDGLGEGGGDTAGEALSGTGLSHAADADVGGREGKTTPTEGERGECRERCACACPDGNRASSARGGGSSERWCV